MMRRNDSRVAIQLEQLPILDGRSQDTEMKMMKKKKNQRETEKRRDAE